MHIYGGHKYVQKSGICTQTSIRKASKLSSNMTAVSKSRVKSWIYIFPSQYVSVACMLIVYKAPATDVSYGCNIHSYMLAVGLYTDCMLLESSGVVYFAYCFSITNFITFSHRHYRCREIFLL
jgi:hypothetical protein